MEEELQGRARADNGDYQIQNLAKAIESAYASGFGVRQLNPKSVIRPTFSFLGLFMTDLGWTDTPFYHTSYCEHTAFAIDLVSARTILMYTQLWLKPIKPFWLLNSNSISPQSSNWLTEWWKWRGKCEKKKTGVSKKNCIFASDNKRNGNNIKQRNINKYRE